MDLQSKSFQILYTFYIFFCCAHIIDYIFHMNMYVLLVVQAKKCDNWDMI